MGDTFLSSQVATYVLGLKPYTEASFAAAHALLSFSHFSRLHLKSSVLVDKFEFALEGIETQFEEILVTEAEGTGEQVIWKFLLAFALTIDAAGS